jgi:hypothetical protein
VTVISVIILLYSTALIPLDIVFLSVVLVVAVRWVGEAKHYA